MTEKEFNKIFDHTILKPPTTEEELKKVCEEAVGYGFCSVAVNTGMVAKCAEFLKGSGVLVDAAVGFPLGITTIDGKVLETEEAIKNGAGEIDYVINIGRIKQGDTDYIKEEMEKIVSVCRRHHVTSKVIFENCYLTDDEKIALCKIADEVKPDFIKTSTGFGPSSATVKDVKLMREYVSSDVKVKAAGGVRDLKSCLAMLEAGAERIGCSNSAAIAEEYKNNVSERF
ncbi:MAG: deoxyribose-phosphate aldolase [Ruminococcaceae bacterium]|nr:deoxyribose-phosphate aldolase [Oscillospiraceae bacterium]